MSIFNVLSLSLLLSLPVPVAQPLEMAFLQNSPEILGGLLTTSGDIPVSLPDPLSLADQLSPDQAYLVFKRIFSVFKTTEFFVDPGLTMLPGRPGGILKTRWSFRNQKTGNQYPVRVFFYVTPEATPPGSYPGTRGIVLKIVEIRAEKL
ncbi:MAG: hypothetical protein ABSG73_05410 [Candidatus Aminicenantales bacterium]